MSRGFDRSVVMDWARNDAGLSDNDLNDVFHYEPKPTTVIKMVESKGVSALSSKDVLLLIFMTRQYQAEVWTLDSHDDWMDWIGDVSSNRSFLILISKG